MRYSMSFLSMRQGRGIRKSREKCGGRINCRSRLERVNPVREEIDSLVDPRFCKRVNWMRSSRDGNKDNYP